MRSARINKKSQIDEMLTHIMIIAFVIIVVVTVVTVYFVYTNQKIQIEDSELRITSNRLINEISTYDLDTGRTYIGVIDSQKKPDIEIAYKAEARIGAKIQMENDAITFNEKWFNRLKPRAGYDAKKIESNAYLIINGEGIPAEIEAVT